MPELPEVETVRATLELKLIGETIDDVVIRYPGIIQEIGQNEFVRKLVGETFTKIARYGKYLFFILTNVTIISHLRMEGKYFIKDINEPIVSHEHIIFNFKSGKSLRYHDTRKFGTMKIVDITIYEEILKTPEIARLAKEATDPTFTACELFEKIKNKKEPIKTALLDQSIICGMGNIYVDEVCFLSNLHPTTSCCLITESDCQNILDNAKIVLSKAIAAGGTTIRSYTSSLGVTGRFQLSLYVHMRLGNKCQKCQTIIEKIQVGGRGTYFCSQCQKINHPLIIGITGGIACGKSVVSKYLSDKGYLVIDTDVISRKLTLEDGVAIPLIKETFGCEYFDNGLLDRKKLGKLIFSNKEENKKLTDILHPLIYQEVVKQIKSSRDNVIFIDVPLMFESGFDKLCKYVICVACNEDLVIDRLIKRDQISASFAKEKINSQMSLDLKKQKSHFIIDNSYDLCYTYNQIEELIKKLLNKRGK